MAGRASFPKRASRELVCRVMGGATHNKTRGCWVVWGTGSRGLRPRQHLKLSLGLFLQKSEEAARIRCKQVVVGTLQTSLRQLCMEQRYSYLRTNHTHALKC